MPTQQAEAVLRFGDANRRYLKQGDEICLTGLGIL
jgi:hypothetical protein